MGKCGELASARFWRVLEAKPRSLGFLGTEEKLDGLNSEAT